MQVWVLYAQDVQELQEDRDAWVKTLEAIENVIWTTVDKLDTKLQGTHAWEKLQEKSKEIDEYFSEISEDIQRETSSSEITEKIDEAKKVVILKVVSWISEDQKLWDTIDSEIANTRQKKDEALQVIEDSLEWDEWNFSLIMRTKYNQKKFKKVLNTLDDNIDNQFLYSSNTYNYFEVTIKNNWIFAQEMLGDIESGIIPESFIGIEIVKPEVFSIDEIDTEKNLKEGILLWEDFTQTWWIEEYKSYRYFTEIKENSWKILVWVVDTGIDYTHPDLISSVRNDLWKDFVNKDDDAIDDQGHGTHVAGTIAASINQSWIIGVNPHVNLVALKICSETGYCPTYAVIKALEYAKNNNIDIINMSLWGRSNPVDHPICDAIADYTNNEGIVVSAAWNSNIDTSNFVPGWCLQSITVWAYDRNFSKASFSNYGTKVDVSAPWVDIYSSRMWGWYTKLSGTSMAAPHITWIVSVIQAYENSTTTSSVKEMLSKNFSKISNATYIAGAINMEGLILDLQDPILVDEIIEVEEVIEDTSWTEVVDDEVKEPIWDTSKNISESYSKKDTSYDDDEDWVKEWNISWPKRQTIEIWDINEILEISSGTGKVDVIDIDQNQESLKTYSITMWDRVFWEDGILIENPTEIQSSETLIKLEANGETTEWFIDEEENDVDEVFEVQELLIDGADKEIRVQGNDDLWYLEFIEDINNSSISQGEWDTINISVEKINFVHDDEIEIKNRELEDGKEFTESWEIIGEELSWYQNTTIETSIIDVSEDKLDTNLKLSEPFIITEDLFIDKENNEIRVNSVNEITEELEVLEYTWEVWDIESWTWILLEDQWEIWEWESELIQDFSASEPISRVDMWEITEPYIAEDGTESIWIQNVYTCEVELWSSCDFSLYKPNRYSFVPDIANMASVTFEDRLASFQGRKVGQVTYTMSRSGTVYHTFVINIVEPQVDETYNISLVRRETKILNIDTRNFWYSYQSNQWWWATMLRLSNGLQFTWTSEGVYTYYAQKYDRTWFLFKVVIEVTPYIPPVDTVEMYMGQTLRYPFLNAHSWYTHEKSNNNVTLGVYGYNAYTISTNTIGTTQVLLKDRWDHTHTLIVNVLPVPVPEEFNATTIEWKDVNIILPRDGRYTFAREPWYTGFARLYDNWDYVLLSWVTPWEINYRIIDDGITHYIINIKILPKEPIIIDTEMYQWQQQVHQISKWNDYDYSVSNQGIVSLQNTSSNLYITWEEVWETQIVLSIWWFPHYIINTQINIPPEPERFQINTQELLSTNISLNPWYYRWTQEKTRDASASITYNQSTGLMSISGHVEGEIILTITDQSNLVRYILNIIIIPNPPEPQELNVLETRELRMQFNSWDTYSYSKSGIIWLRRVSSELYLQWIKWWYAELYIRNSAWRHYKTFLVTVEPAPIAQEYSIVINVKQSWEITLPENISSYNFYIDTQTPFTDSDWDKSFSISWDRTFMFRWEQSGTAIIELRDSRNFAIYRVTIRVNIYETDFEIIQTEERDPGLSYNDDHVSDAPDIAYVSGWYDEIRAIQPWIANIKSYDDGIHYRTTHVTVLPIPDPIQINCDMYRWETCRLDYSHGWRGISYTTSRSDAFEVEYGNSTLRVKWLAIWTARVTVKARHGEYIKYIMNVNVLPEPPEIHQCEIPEWTICQTMWWDDYGSYRITSTNASVVRVWLEQYSQTFVNGTRKMERTVIEWLSPWYAEVYIYENQDHRYTVKMTITDPIPPISVADGSVTLKQWERIEIDILSGWGDYRELEYEEDMIYFDVDSSADGLWDVEISWKSPWITYPKFRDKYYQEYQMSVKITDTTLDLNWLDENNELVFDNYQPQYISARNYYWDVLVSTSNSNFSVRKDVFEDWQIGFLITPVQNGETTFTFTDNEPGGVNTKTVLVSVWGWWNNEETPTEQDSEFGSLFLLNDESDITLQKILAFNILWNYSEVGIEMKNEFWEYVRQSIDKSEDGFYILQLDEETCNNCNSFVPYFIDFVWNTVYAQQIWDYLSYNEDKFQNIALEDSQIWVADFNTDIRISWVKEYWKQIELATTDVVVAWILWSAVAYWQLSSRLDYLPHDLPIASYMLARFMNGDWWYDYYNSTHWISEELKLTSWYSDRKEYIMSNIDSFSDLNIWEEKPIDFKIEKIYDVNLERQQDFANSFWNIWWNQYVTKNLDGNIEMIIKISDDYDFHLFKWSIFIWWNNLNGWAEYYQSRWYWKPFTWNLSIYELTN